jgi:hypothetical protein
MPVNRKALFFAVMVAGVGLWSFARGNVRDPWWRKDPAAAFPAGADAHSVLLVNSGTAPLFVEISSASWDGPRQELLLPGDEQWVGVPGGQDGGPMRMAATVLDMPAAEHHVVEIPGSWGATIVTIGADGTPAVRQKDIGDSSPKRNMAIARTEYRYPVRVELPYDAHERPVGRDLETHQWMGPGTNSNGVGCATALRPGVQFTCAVPRPAEPTLVIDEAVSVSGTTRITLRWDGSVARDRIPLARRLQRWAGL